MLQPSAIKGIGFKETIIYSVITVTLRLQEPVLATAAGTDH